MTEIERIFKTYDLNTTESLYQNKKDTIQDLEKNSDDSNDSKQAISDLTKQIGELRQQLEEAKQSLKVMLAEAKDYAQKLFNWFKTENAKQLTLQDNGEILVEHNDGKKKILSSAEVEKNETLVQFKEYSQQSQQNSLTFSELSQISGSSPSPTNEKRKHWDKYGKCYIGTGIILVLISVGAAIYHFWTKKQEK